MSEFSDARLLYNDSGTARHVGDNPVGKLICAGLLLLVTIQVSFAHEYWLDPIGYRLKPGEKLIVDARTGVDFQGTSFPYDPSVLASAVLTGPEGRQSYEGRLGDYPAFHFVPDKPGLWSIAVETSGQQLDYATWQDFNTFLDYHGLDEIARQHKAERRPDTNIREHYVRFAKAFFKSLDSTDRSTLLTSPVLEPLGMLFEIVLLSDPYLESAVLKVRLLYKGEPLAGRQIELFSKAGTVERVTATTDTSGEASFDVGKPAEYLINAVHVVSATSDTAHWRSLWASVSFERKKF